MNEDVNGPVNVSPWLIEPVSLTLAFQHDTLFVMQQDSGFSHVYVQNLLNPGDVLQLDVFDTRSWLNGLSSSTVAFTDSMGAATTMRDLAAGCLGQ